MVLQFWISESLSFVLGLEIRLSVYLWIGLNEVDGVYNL